MRKNLIRKLATASFDKNVVSKNKVDKISKSLKREDLKAYIKDLKNMDARLTVKITVPNEEGINELKDYFNRIYPDKKIVINFDSSLLTGIKVEDYDNVYELSLKNFLDEAVKESKYD